MWNRRGPAEDSGFKVTFAVIAAVHLLALGLLLSFSLHLPKPVENDLVWVNPDSFAGGVLKGNQNPPVSAGTAPSAVPAGDEPVPEEKVPPTPVPENQAPLPPALPPPVSSPSNPSLEPPLPTPSPAPATSAAPRPTATLTPKPSPKVKTSATPRPKPVPRPMLTPAPSALPKPSPKESTSSATFPKPLNSPRSTPAPKASASARPSPSPSASPIQGKRKEGTPPRAEPTTSPGPGDSTEANEGNRNEGGTGHGQGNADLSGYAQTIKMRFDSAWDQPRGQIPSGSHLVATVRLKIQPDGTVSEFALMQGSGNPVVDETVRAAGRKITRLPPPPGGGVFSPVVRFELGD